MQGAAGDGREMTFDIAASCMIGSTAGGDEGLSGGKEFIVVVQVLRDPLRSIACTSPDIRNWALGRSARRGVGKATVIGDDRTWMSFSSRLSIRRSSPGRICLAYRLEMICLLTTIVGPKPRVRQRFHARVYSCG